MKKSFLILTHIFFLGFSMGSPITSLAMMNETGAEEGSSDTKKDKEGDAPPIDEVSLPYDPYETGPSSLSVKVVRQPEGDFQDHRAPSSIDFGVPKFGYGEQGDIFSKRFRENEGAFVDLSELGKPLPGFQMGKFLGMISPQMPEFSFHEGGAGPSSKEGESSEGSRFSSLPTIDRGSHMPVFSAGGGRPWDHESFSSLSPAPAKPMKRRGIELPYVDPKKIGLVDYFKRYGVEIDQRWDLGALLPEYKPFEFLTIDESLYKFEPAPLLFSPDPSLLEPLELSLVGKLPNLLEEDPPIKPEQLEASEPKKQSSQEDLSSLSDEEIIERFKSLTETFYIKPWKLIYDPEDTTEPLKILRDAEDPTERVRLLEELVKDPRARGVILEASKATDDLLHKAWKNHYFFADRKVLHVLLSENEFVDHLSTVKNEHGKNLLWSGLMGAIVLNLEEEIAIYYKHPRLFAHLVNRVREKKSFVKKLYLEAGLLMSLSSRDEKEIRELLNVKVLKYLAHDKSLLASIAKNFTEDRNHALAKIFFEEHEFSLDPALLLAALEVPALWSHLSEETQGKLLKTAQSTFPDVDRETLEEEHRVLVASEHALTSHPQTLEDMERFAPDLGQAYREVQKSKEGRTISRLKEMHRLEQEFLCRLQQENGSKTLSTPWVAAGSGYAYTQGVFGQGVKALVVELDELPEVQRERLLQDHLGSKTRFQDARKGRKVLHNVGVTSLVSRMAPMTEVVSTRSSQLDSLAQEISSREFPFINCSWGPTSALDKDTSVSIFSSCKNLNDLLGLESVVLVKSAGNEGLSLSHPDLKGDPCGIFFSKLLCRLSPEQLSNVILAVNIMPSKMVADSSNTPGRKEEIYRNTLSAQGSDTFWLDESGYDYRPLMGGGTSSAAPLITGAAALVKSKKPHFSPVQVKSCLLHSASREFERCDAEGKNTEWVYESEPQANASLNQVLYRFEDYGMGILNVRSALLYADALEEVLFQRQQQQNSEPMTFEEYEALRKNIGRNLKDKDVVLPIQIPASSKKEKEEEV